MDYEAHPRSVSRRANSEQTNQFVRDRLRTPEPSARTYAGTATSNSRTNSFASSHRERRVSTSRPRNLRSIQYANNERRRSRVMFPGAPSSRVSVIHDLVVESILDSYEDYSTVPFDRSPWPSLAEKRFSAATGTSTKRTWSKRITKWILCLLLIATIIAAAMFPVYFFVIKPRISKSVNSDSGSAGSIGSNNGSGNSTDGNNFTGDTPHSVSNKSDPSSLDIPPSAVGTVLDSTKWLDWTDFNLTYTNATVGGLSLMVNLVSRMGD